MILGQKETKITGLLQNLNVGMSGKILIAEFAGWGLGTAVVTLNVQNVGKGDKMYDVDCPYCGYEMEGCHLFEDEDNNRTEAKCGKCKKHFKVERDFSVEYFTEEIDTNVKHIYRRQHLDGEEIYTYCKVWRTKEEAVNFVTFVEDSDCRRCINNYKYYEKYTNTVPSSSRQDKGPK